MMGPFMFMGGWTIIFWIIIAGLIVWGIVALTRREGSKSRSSVEIASERYAKGEISQEEFERIKKNLT